MKISLAMIVKNEERTIKRCLDSVVDLVDEIVIVDTGSTDKTISLISEYPKVKLFHYKWNNNFSEARNYSIENTTGDYILVLDADEYLIRGTKLDLTSIAAQSKVGRINIVSKYESEGEVRESKTLTSRFFPKSIRYTGIIHEQLDTTLARVPSNIVVHHMGYFMTNKTSRNIPLLLQELKINPNDSYYLYQLGKEYRNNEEHERSFECFFRSYENLSKEESFLSELVTELIKSGKHAKQYIKTLEIIRESETKLNHSADFHFSVGLFYMDYLLDNPSKADIYFDKIQQSFIKCIDIGDSNSIVGGAGSYMAYYNLGVFYEVLGLISEAKTCYGEAARYDYHKAKDRLAII